MPEYDCSNTTWEFELLTTVSLISLIFEFDN